MPSPVKYSQTFRDKKLSAYQESRIKKLLKRFKRRKIVDDEYADFLVGQIDFFPWTESELFKKSVEGLNEEEETLNGNFEESIDSEIGSTIENEGVDEEVIEKEVEETVESAEEIYGEEGVWSEPESAKDIPEEDL